MLPAADSGEAGSKTRGGHRFWACLFVLDDPGIGAAHRAGGKAKPPPGHFGEALLREWSGAALRNDDYNRCCRGGRLRYSKD